MLKELYAERKELFELERQLNALRKEHGIDALEKRIKGMKEELKEKLKEAYDGGYSEEGSIRILLKGRKSRTVLIDPLLEAHPEARQYLKIGMTDVKKMFKEEFIEQGMKAAEATEAAQEELDMYCDMTIAEQHEIVDVMDPL